MKFIIDRTTLLNELTYLQSAVEKRQTLPILSYLLIEASAGKLALRATDLDLMVTTECPAEVPLKGAICLPARKLWEIVKSLPPAEIHCLVGSDNQAELKCAGARFKLAGLKLEDYPEDHPYEGVWSELDGEMFARFIPRILHAICQEESRYALNGAKFEINREHVRFVATDGHRLALAERQGVFLEAMETDVLIPKKALNELAKLCAEAEEAVQIGVGEHRFYAKAGRRQVSARLLSGEFPDYHAVIPTNNEHCLTLNCATVAPAIRRVALMAESRNRSITWALEAGQLQLTANDEAGGEAKDSLTVDYQGADVSIGFNVHFLSDFFNAVEEDQVSFSFKDANSQALLTVDLDAQDRFQEVIMPLRL